MFTDKISKLHSLDLFPCVCSLSPYLAFLQYPQTHRGEANGELGGGLSRPTIEISPPQSRPKLAPPNMTLTQPHQAATYELAN